MRKSTKSNLNKYLKSLTKAELEKEVGKLYTKFKPVKEYYAMELSGDSSKVLAEYKKKIEKEYFPTRGFGKARSGESRKIVNAFKKIAVHPKDVVEILLFRTEMMLDYTNAFGDIDMPFYESLASSFDEACKLIQQEKLEDLFKEKCIELLNDASGLGWGVQDDLGYSIEAYFGTDFY